jgi:CPA2 family monovalent cation:H+ antiporter-2
VHGQLVTDLLLLIAIATLGVAVFERLRLPSIAAFLVMGALVGPGGLGVIEDPERVMTLAELGVVFLLFEIGLELPLERLRLLWRPAVLGGGLQVAATLLCVTGLGVTLGLSLPSALVVGALVAMSSTALVMRLLSDRGEIDTPQGQICVGVLLFQDLCIVPFLLAIPVLAAGSGTGGGAIALAVLRALVALAGFFVVFRFVLPFVLARAAQARSREVFTMVGFLVVVGSAVVAEEVGLTLAVGAFVGGLVLSASPYAHQLFAEVVPLRGVLLGVFFTAVGMLFDPRAAAENWPGVAVYAGGVVLLKAGFVIAIVALVLRQGLRLAVLSGLSLAQTGEFSFVLAAAASAAGLLDAELRQVFVAGSIATLVATPFLMEAAPRLAGFLTRVETDSGAPVEAETEHRDHVVLIGFGLAGQTLGRVLKALEIPYRAVDANAASVQRCTQRGEPVVYGDAARRPVLRTLGVEHARLVAISISDPLATREVVRLVRSLAPDVQIVARTRYIRGVDDLHLAGANRVVVEEFESMLELLGGVLPHFGVPPESIARFTEQLRDEGYEFMRSPEMILDPWLAETVSESTAASWVDVPDALELETSIAELDVRARSGASIVAVERGGATTTNPPPGFGLRRGDRVLVLGKPEQVEQLRRLLAGEAGES